MMSVYRAGYNCANSPAENSYGIVKTMYIDGSDYVIQEFVSLATGYYYIRLKLNKIWSKWYTHAHTGILNDLTTTAKDSIVSAVNEVKYKIEIIQGIEVDTEGDLVTPIKIGKSIPFMFESTDRLGWKHIFIKNVNKSSDYWIWHHWPYDRKYFWENILFPSMNIQCYFHLCFFYFN